MTFKEQLRALMDKDGPNLTMRTLSIYCGLPHSQISNYLHDKVGISEKRLELAKRGLRELAQEIMEIATSNETND